MSKQFELGKTYKLNEFVLLGIKLLLQAEYTGEEGVFTVHKLDDDGTIWTDDITSGVTKARCHIPADIIEDCEEVTDASRTTH